MNFDIQDLIQLVFGIFVALGVIGSLLGKLFSRPMKPGDLFGDEEEEPGMDEAEEGRPAGPAFPPQRRAMPRFTGPRDEENLQWEAVEDEKVVGMETPQLAPFTAAPDPAQEVAAGVAPSDVSTSVHVADQPVNYLPPGNFSLPPWPRLTQGSPPRTRPRILGVPVRAAVVLAELLGPPRAKRPFSPQRRSPQ